MRALSRSEPRSTERSQAGPASTVPTAICAEPPPTSQTATAPVGRRRRERALEREPRLLVPRQDANRHAGRAREQCARADRRFAPAGRARRRRRRCSAAPARARDVGEAAQALGRLGELRRPRPRRRARCRRRARPRACRRRRGRGRPGRARRPAAGSCSTPRRRRRRSSGVHSSRRPRPTGGVFPVNEVVKRAQAIAVRRAPPAARRAHQRSPGRNGAARPSSGRPALPRSVRLKLPGGRVLEQRIERGAEPQLEPGILDRRDGLEPVVQVPRQEVGAADEVPPVASRLEVEDAAVLEEAAEHAADADVLAHPLHARAGAAQTLRTIRSIFAPGLRGEVELVDDRLVAEVVDLQADPRLLLRRRPPGRPCGSPRSRGRGG